jgi:hypothetical protein
MRISRFEITPVNIPYKMPVRTRTKGIETGVEEKINGKIEKEYLYPRKNLGLGLNLRRKWSNSMQLPGLIR